MCMCINLISYGSLIYHSSLRLMIEIEILFTSNCIKVYLSKLRKTYGDNGTHDPVRRYHYELGLCHHVIPYEFELQINFYFLLCN